MLTNSITIDTYNLFADFLYQAKLTSIPLSDDEMLKLFDIDQQNITSFAVHPLLKICSGKVDGTPHYIQPGFFDEIIIEDNSWFPLNRLSSFLSYFADRIGFDQLIDKIAIIIDSKYNYVNTTQANGLIKRSIGFGLTQSERNGLYRLRKRIEEFHKIITRFEQITEPRKETASIDKKTLQDGKRYEKLGDISGDVDQEDPIFECMECDELVRPENDTNSQILRIPEHHNQTMIYSSYFNEYDSHKDINHEGIKTAIVALARERGSESLDAEEIREYLIANDLIPDTKEFDVEIFAHEPNTAGNTDQDQKVKDVPSETASDSSVNYYCTHCSMTIPVTANDYEADSGKIKDRYCHDRKMAVMFL